MTRKMKDSGVSYLDKIPEDWECTDFRRCVSLKQGLQIAQSERFHEYAPNRYLYITLKYVNSINKDEKEYIENPDIGVKCEENDILFVRTGSTGLIVTGVSGVFHNNFFKIIYNKKYLRKNYLIYYLNQNNIQEHFKLLAGTTTISDLNHGDFLDTKIILPPIDIQEKIETYLDKKCNKIDQTIEKEKEVIEKLKEYKQSVITEAVTKGLNPDVKMKDSGVEWIGEIPEKWICIPLKSVTNFKEGPGIMASDFRMQGVPLIRISGMKSKYVSLEGCNYLDENMVEKRWKSFLLEYNDIVISASASTDMVAKVDESTVGCIPYTGLIRFRTNDNLLVDYLLYYIKSSIYKEQIDIQKTGAMIQHYGPTHISRLKIILPKDKDEQQQIVNYLDKKCSAIDKLISNKEKVIEKLTEYKKSLIYECVTGKREVQ